MRFKHIYSTFRSISVQTHESLMLIGFIFAKYSHKKAPRWTPPSPHAPPVAFACSAVSRLQIKTHFVRKGHIFLPLLPLFPPPPPPPPFPLLPLLSLSFSPTLSSSSSKEGNEGSVKGCQKKMRTATVNKERRNESTQDLKLKSKERKKE